jgi:predicted AAA+ superfamily ATPase
MEALTPALERLLTRAESLIGRLESWVPGTALQEVDWNHLAWRWKRQGNQGYLAPVLRPPQIGLNDLKDIEDQKCRVAENTRHFVEGRTANNVLLTGARGTGKSSLVKALLHEFGARGLRLIEMDKDHLTDLPELVAMIATRPERFIIFSDDLSFESGEPQYKALKAILDGSVESTSENVLIYATSNRRHLMPEYFSDNAETRHVDEEIHPGEAVEEKISLSDRFGLWVSFYSFDQNAYLEIVEHWVGVLGGALDDGPALRQAALQWALMRGSRSGRTAWHFARHWSGGSR